MSKKKNRPHGHYCKICGEEKANEKFSGKGHAAHICKTCSRLSAAEKAAAMDMNRLMNFPMRWLSESEKKWLKAKIHNVFHLSDCVFVLAACLVSDSLHIFGGKTSLLKENLFCCCAKTKAMI
ncbi:hypothetical protein IMSAGC012_00786 [Lachnospiraceae bacterium]|nr:hypothetical protein IMSAGC012_00786 [Lachnospiraceae bacterium]